MPPSAQEWKRRQGSGLSPTCSNPAICSNARTHTNEDTGRMAGIHAQAWEKKQDAIIDAAPLTLPPETERERERERRGGRLGERESGDENKIQQKSQEREREETERGERE